MNIPEQKSEIRTELLNFRKSLSEKRYQEYSNKINQRLQSVDVFQKASVVHCYISINDRREVDTHDLIKHMLLAGTTKVVAPVTDFQSQKLDHRHLTSFDALELNKWSVLEPINGSPIAITELDMVIVPMVGADEQKNRIGYGGGFYDRFLKDISVPKIGLVFEGAVIDQLPVESMDIPMDLIITEQRIIS